MSGRHDLPGRLRREVASALDLDPARLHLLYINGWRMDLSSLTALAFAPGDRQPRLVAKVARGSECLRVRAERDNLRDLHEAPLGDLAPSLPRPIAFSEDEEAAVLLETVVPGEPFDPAAEPGRIPGFLALANDWLIRFHRATGARAVVLTAAEVERLLAAPIADYLRRFRPAPAERRLLERTLGEAQGLHGASLPLVWHHDDFGPPNLLVEPGPPTASPLGWGGDRLGVIDWETRFAPRLPAFDLIHLLACLGVGPAGRASEARDDLDRFERAFFEDNPLSRAARAAVATYARALAIPGDVLRLLFTVYWVVYALEKVDAIERAAAIARASGTNAPELAVWSLARFENGTCLNLQRLAERERSIVFP